MGRRVNQHKVSSRHRSTAALRAVSAIGWLLAVVLLQAPAAADPDEMTQRNVLFQQSLKRPQDVALATAYADACIKLQDYEGAIGALERVLFFAPNDAHLNAEIGFLYVKLHSYQLAKQYFDTAVANPDLDEATRSTIAALEPTVQTAITGSHAFAFLQAGVRYQTNAAFNPDNNILRLSNQDYALSHPRDRGSDANGFQTLQLGYDHDLDDQHGDTIEVRLTGYATQQVRFTDLNVGLYDVSIGPRLKLAPDQLPDWTIKPYAVGGQAFLAGARYLSSGGAGIVMDVPVRPGYVLEPGAEVRKVQFENVSVFSSLNSGDTVSVSLAGTAEINATLSALARVYWTRDSANAGYQTSNNVAEEFALVARFASPLGGGATTWSVSPYVKFLQTDFAAPNPYIDVNVTRHDKESQVGLVLDTPLSAAFTIVTNVQFARVASNIPNYRLSNVSILTGPAVRF